MSMLRGRAVLRGNDKFGIGCGQRSRYWKGSRRDMSMATIVGNQAWRMIFHVE